MNNIGLFAIVAAIFVIAITGCTTTSTTAPDGTTTVTKAMDAETAVAMAQLALTSAEQAFDMWLIYAEKEKEVDAAKWEQEKALRAERIANMQATLAALIEARAALQAQAVN